MQLTVTGKQLALGEAFRRHVETSLEAILEKYFKTAIEAHVVLSREAYLNRAELSLRIGRRIAANASAAAADFHTAFDIAAERVAKQLRRYKRRLRDYRARAPQEEGAEAIGAATAPLPDEDDETTAGDAPAVIAEIGVEPPSLTVGEAAQRMDRSGLPVLLFRNRSHGELNLVYRRADGNIGWIDPDFVPARRPPAG
ncbi:MAG TPA: ribosome-associated translation inhibitor RaiA [Stellaceae bacterium]|nr:ribosome-associated translation inhibitor RaiA [Stellaceae bacterium]